ncbi:DUF885 domain-containing protein [Microbacterium halophytorum]|uniref:DUF885 domain-containing protein n=1 Tax=Microbacterium halophytorum TaxID=2067568 RepID=UPI0015729EC7|nr:DUF885 domain-containing protein [Microbacterium halophytorum]
MAERRSQTAVDRIAEAWVDTETRLDLITATYIGRDAGRTAFADYGPAGRAEAREAARAARSELLAAEPADDVDRVTQADLVATLDDSIALEEAGWNARDLNVIESPPQMIRDALDLMPTDGAEDWAAIAARLASIPASLAGYTETLREGMAAANVPARHQVAEVIAQLDRMTADTGFFATFGSDEALGGAVGADLARGRRAAREAYTALREFLASELAPVAGETDGVGRELYALHSRTFLGARIDLDETYEWGMEELARMVAEQEAAAGRVLPGATVREAVAHLEASPDHKLHGTEALRHWMQETSDRAVEELGRAHFDIPDELRTLECLIAPTQEGGVYYTGPTDDFSRPGRMWWSVPAGVTEFETWRELTTVYHEGVPGHHLQIGQAVHNRASLNAWRRLLAGTSGHAEGWALYAERLMDELGYMDDPANRLGMLDAQRFRAARVVLDIGVHLGKPRPGSGGTWDRDYALEFMRSHVNMPDEEIRFEVNRYLGWPGQAPSYKVGQRIWEQIRDEARAREGAEFSLRDFHRRALGLGGVGLDTLRSALSAG